MNLKRISLILPLVLLFAALALAACGTSEEETEPAAPSQPAPAATQAPAPAQPAPAATQAPAPAQPPAEAPMGAALIGDLEGPEVITDAGMMPSSFNEAPQFAELVSAGKLPPVEERIGKDPLVIKPVHSVGEYGGIWRRGFSGPADKWNGYRCCTGTDHVLYWDYTGANPVPNMPRDGRSDLTARALRSSCARG